ncbi:uncharacterized protein LOC118497985 [Phyllostomus discolor]|uniref:Uncharacterized protein LOC118497985 n=1 Tax=Phyllostomus discolor TaxID=89673 RepID=A0A7E6CTE7_9CHIR|nr:uncharacterized protein LOC118497985 [Phyllostomus discolor]
MGGGGNLPPCTLTSPKVGKPRSSEKTLQGGGQHGRSPGRVTGQRSFERRFPLLLQGGVGRDGRLGESPVPKREEQLRGAPQPRYCTGTGREEPGEPERLLGWLQLRWLHPPAAPSCMVTSQGEFAPLGQSRAGTGGAVLTATPCRLSHPIRASHMGFLVLFPPPSSLLSGPLHQLSCVTTGTPPSSSKRTLVKNGLQGSKGRGRRSQSCTPDMDLV